MANEEIIIDGENALLGRLASYTAKQALLGKTVIIVNAEKVMISGNRKNILSNYLQMRRRPHVRFPSNPERILLRTIRGMINYKSGRGAEAYERIFCYNETPEKYKDSKKVKSHEKRNLLTLKELSGALK